MTPAEEAATRAEPHRSVGSRRHRRAFWVVAFAFLMVMALGTVPSPLYSVYRARDHFSLFIVTVAFAVYSVGVIVALLLAGHLSDLYGRRRTPAAEAIRSAREQVRCAPDVRQAQSKSKG
jgi:hypothetical protein